MFISKTKTTDSKTFNIQNAIHTPTTTKQEPTLTTKKGSIRRLKHTQIANPTLQKLEATPKEIAKQMAIAEMKIANTLMNGTTPENVINAFPEIEKRAEKALQLDPDLLSAYMCLGAIAAFRKDGAALSKYIQIVNAKDPKGMYEDEFAEEPGLVQEVLQMFQLMSLMGIDFEEVLFEVLREEA